MSDFLPIDHFYPAPVSGMWDQSELECMIDVDYCFFPAEENSSDMQESYELWLRAVQRCSKFYGP